MQTDNRSLVYPIGKVEEMTGLTGRQIRYYEEKGLISPQRTRGNQRRFSLSDISRLRKIKALIDQDLDIETVRKMLDRTDTSAIDPGDDLVPQTPFANAWPEDHHLQSLYPVSNRAKLAKILTSIDDSSNDD